MLNVFKKIDLVVIDDSFFLQMQLDVLLQWDHRFLILTELLKKLNIYDEIRTKLKNTVDNFVDLDTMLFILYARVLCL